MKTFKTKFAYICSATLLVACAGYSAQDTGPARVAEGVLTDSKGMTLYTFDRDVSGSGRSVCIGPCATNWPPLMVTDKESAGGDYSVVVREDGKKQWAYKGKPLYHWSKDQKPGDKTGDGFNNVWRAAKP
jgi:predicted lipoprotein with Yx(FWY)xxD motif